MTSQQVLAPLEAEPHLQSHDGNFRQGVLYTGLGSVVGMVLLFAETMIVVRLLPTEGYGVYVLLIAAVNFLVALLDFGCKTAVTQFIASGDHDRQIGAVHSTVAFRMVVLVTFSILVWAVRGLGRIPASLGDLAPYIAYIPLMVAAESLDELLLAMHQGLHAFRKMAVAQIGRGILRLCLSVLFLVALPFGILGLIYSWTASFAVSIAYQYLVLPIPKRIRWQLPLLGRILKFGFPLQLNRLLWYASSRADVLLLGVFLGPVSVAFYNIAATIPNALIRLAQSYVAVFFPTLASMRAEGQTERASRMLNRSLRLCSFLGALIAVGAVVFSKEIIRLLFSEQYVASAGAFSLLMIAFHMTFLVSLMGYALTASGFPKRSLAQNVTNVVCAVVLDLLLIPGLGMVGPALAQLISSYVANPVSVLLLRRSELRVTVTHYVKQTALLWLCAGLFWWTAPSGLPYKLAIVVLYVVSSAGLATVSAEDLKLMLPGFVTRRLTALREALFHSR